MRSLLLALQFLSIFPIKIKGDVTEADMLRSAYAFTVTGFLIGVVLVIADFFLAQLFSSALVSALVLLVLVLITGALHLDGLADTFDALACRGGREDKLSAMRDPSSGPVGMVAVMFVLGLKFLAIEEVASLSYYLHYVALLFMPVMGRWVQVAGMFLGKPSRPDGLGTIFIGKVGTGIFITTTAIALLLFAAVSLVAGSYAPGMWYVYGGAGFALVFVIAIVLVGLFKRNFGGQSGDTLGAATELSELAFLLWTITWSRLFI